MLKCPEISGNELPLFSFCRCETLSLGLPNITHPLSLFAPCVAFSDFPSSSLIMCSALWNLLLNLFLEFVAVVTVYFFISRNSIGFLFKTVNDFL